MHGLLCGRAGVAPRGRAGPCLRSHALVFLTHHAQYFCAHDDLAFYEAAGEELFLCHRRLVAEQLSQDLPRNDRIIEFTSLETYR